MMEMFEILTSGHSAVDKSRLSVHSRTELAHLNTTNIWPTVTTARNPYSRLYSAYVDKIFLPNIYNTSRIIRAHLLNQTSHDLCGNDVTFEQFLDFIIRTSKSQEVLNRHWAPINSMCHLCTNDNHMIVKQESFSDDIEDLLDSLHVTGETFDRVKSLMGQSRLESTIPGIVKVVLSKRSEYLDCLSGMNVLEKLWKSFQIQGYISDNMPFPSGEISTVSDEVSVDVYSDFFVQKAKTSGVSKENSKLQRNRYLTNAYKEVSQETIEEIKRLYKADFLMFDYSMDLPI